ncbi:hypothetical protein M1R59_001567 [Campylobacter jejuni]|nr:hypothetical protein [Campylobacter jejuni]
MVFLIPLLIIIGVIFGIDYVYFKNQDLKAQVKKEQKELNSSLEKEKKEQKELNSSLEKEKKEYIEKLFKTK